MEEGVRHFLERGTASGRRAPDAKSKSPAQSPEARSALTRKYHSGTVTMSNFERSHVLGCSKWIARIPQER